MPSSSSATDSVDHILDGLRVTLVGKLGGVNRREAQAIIREHGGMVVPDTKDREGRLPDLVVIGADELP